MIYLDSAATSFYKPAGVPKAMLNAMHTMSSPGRGSYTQALKAADTVYECRELVAELFNVKETERIVFTSNATHSLNIAIRSLAEHGDKVIISGYEHNSVTRVLKAIGTETVIASSQLFEPSAAIDSYREELEGAKLAIINHVSNVFGYVQPVYKIAELCKMQGVPLIIDASQSAGVIEIDADKLGAAFIAMPGHKGLLGPQGTGILICNIEPRALMFGGTGSDSKSQSMPSFLPDMLEAGTHNIPGIAGLSEGVRYVLKKSPEQIGEYERNLRRLMQERLRKIEALELFYTSADCQSGVLSVRHLNMDTEQLCDGLGKRGVAARCGLHCAPLAHLSAGTIDTGTVRFSFSPFNTEADIIRASKAIENEIVHKK